MLSINRIRKRFYQNPIKLMNEQPTDQCRAEMCEGSLVPTKGFPSVITHRCNVCGQPHVSLSTIDQYLVEHQKSIMRFAAA